MPDPSCCNDIIVASSCCTLAVFPALFVEDPPTNGDFLVLVLQISPLFIGAPRKQIGIPEC